MPDEKRARGRPTKFEQKFVDQARKLAALGATDREVADFFEVDEATIHRWKHSHSDFCESLKLGKGPADDRVEQSLYRRALGYSHDAVKIIVAGGEIHEVPIVEHYPPDTAAAIFWLKNRRQDEWRDKPPEAPKDDPAGVVINRHGGLPPKPDAVD